MDAPPVQYVPTSDGASLAYCVSGSGRTLVFVPPGFSNAQLVWRFYPDWMSGLTNRFRLIQYDLRGEGLSTRSLPPDLSIDTYVRDLETVIDSLELERVALWAFGPRTHIALRYALSHRGRVDALLLHTCSAANSAWDAPVVTSANQWEHLVRSLASMNSRGLSQEEEERLVEDYKSCSTMEFWQAHRIFWESDLTQELTALHIPTLVLHQREHYMLKPEESMKLAAMIPGAQFSLLDTWNLFGNATQGLAAIDQFIASLPRQAEASRSESSESLSDRELEVLRLLAQGKSNPEIAKELFITRNTVQNHVSSILIKTNLSNRAQAAVYARDHGLA